MGLRLLYVFLLTLIFPAQGRAYWNETADWVVIVIHYRTPPSPDYICSTPLRSQGPDQGHEEATRRELGLAINVGSQGLGQDCEIRWQCR